jgi:hypothetical protein
MKKEVRGILVDPETQEVKAVQYSDLDSIYKLLDCTNIEYVALDDEHGAYIDGESKMCKPEEDEKVYNTWFHNAMFGIQGKILIIGPPGPDGEETGCKLPVYIVKNAIEKFTEGFEPPADPIITFE